MEQHRNSLPHHRQLIGMLAALCTGCAPDSTENTSETAVPDAAAFADQVVLSNREYLQQAAYATADVEWGARLAMQCRACHTLEKNGATLLGPNLHGVFGRAAASAKGFDYSQALASASLAWTPAALDAWLAVPSQFLPGNRMAFAGIPKAADRHALIAYLLRTTDASVVSEPADAP
jgi:cytochrome c